MNSNMVRSFTSPMPVPRLQTSNSSSSVSQLPNHHDSHNSTHSQPSRNSDSTQNTSTSTLFSPAQHNGMITATDNVINRIADKDASLFQICMTLRARLAGVPGFEEQILQVEDEMGTDVNDSVQLLWNVFRKGYPLLLIYNALQPSEPLEVDGASVAETKRAQMAMYKFTQACITQLRFLPAECYMLSDLKPPDSKGEEINMSGFNKVVRQVGRVVDMLVERGLLASLDGDDDRASMIPRAKRTHREHVLDELVRTERTYVQHLELLQGFSRHVSQAGIIPGDAVHDIFLNLDELLEFQRRFLVRVEQTNAQHEVDQNWGRLFYTHAQIASETRGMKTFSVYEPFIENQRRCEETTMREFDKLRLAGGPTEVRQMVESSTHLTAFLLKPFQRLSKYPLLLKELRNKGDLSEPLKEDLTLAIEAVTAVLNRTNASLDRQDRQQAVKDLKAQVEDWKHHRVEAFGELLLYGTHTVLKGDANNEKNEREYRMYLFEKILLCCKEINMNKAKNRGKAFQVDKRGKPRLQLKGRIFMQNVTDTAYRSATGIYTCQIFWRGDDTIENFLIKFSTEEVMKKWSTRLEEQRRICQEQARQNYPADTEFYGMSSQHRENPYKEDGAGDDDDTDTAIGYAESTNLTSRNGSSTSLRSRSTTGESGPPGRFGKSAMALSNLPPITTGMTESPMSPADRMAAGSYFSPGAESPKSSRTSQSSTHHFPGLSRQGTYQTNYSGDEHNRYTAPAGGRPGLVRDGSGNPMPGYGSSGYPTSQARLRSMSNPDVHNQANRRPHTTNAPPVPSLPQHLTQGAGINRSQTNSPMMGDEHSMTSPQQEGPPTQLKVKVKVPSEGSSMTLVVPFNIGFEKLKDRIDVKLQRTTNLTLASGGVKLKYWDEDDYVSMQTDDDVQNAFETFKEQQGRDIVGHLGEIELYVLKSST